MVKPHIQSQLFCLIFIGQDIIKRKFAETFVINMFSIYVVVIKKKGMKLSNGNKYLPSIFCCWQNELWSCDSDTDPVNPVEPDGEKRLGVKDRRRGRRERRSTGIVQPGEVRKKQPHIKYGREQKSRVLENKWIHLCRNVSTERKWKDSQITSSLSWCNWWAHSFFKRTCVSGSHLIVVSS